MKDVEDSGDVVADDGEFVDVDVDDDDASELADVGDADDGDVADIGDADTPTAEVVMPGR